jgi:hypothetical protein
MHCRNFLHHLNPDPRTTETQLVLTQEPSRL